MDKKRFSTYIKTFDFKNLFIELGWDNFTNTIPVAVDDTPFELKGIAQKRGFVILLCPPSGNFEIPQSPIRKKIENNVTFFITFTTKPSPKAFFSKFCYLCMLPNREPLHR